MMLINCISTSFAFYVKETSYRTLDHPILGPKFGPIPNAKSMFFPNSTNKFWIWQKKLELSENLTIAPLLCFACSKRPEFLRILSVKQYWHQSRAITLWTNLRKMTANNPNVDLVSINNYIKFGQNLSTCSKDIERKQNFGVNQGP